MDVEPKPPLEITEDDFNAALRELYAGGSWTEVKARAARFAAGRALRVNGDRQHVLIARLKETFGDEWKAAQLELTELFAEHDVLIEIAFPMDDPG